MTIQEMQKSEKAFLLATDVCEVIGVNPHSIRVAAKERPDLLGFPVTVMGKSVLIPRIPFMEYIGIKNPAEGG